MPEVTNESNVIGFSDISSGANQSFSGSGVSQDNPDMYGNVPSSIPINQTQHPQQQQYQQQQQPNTQDAQREAFFQAKYDKMASTLKNYGIELDPKMDDYNRVFDPVFKSYQAMQMINSQPERLIELTKHYFPNRIIEPDYTETIKAKLDQEFGGDFIPDPSDLAILGTPSWKYHARANQLLNEIQMGEIQQRWESQIKEQQEQYQRQQEYMGQLNSVAAKYNMAPEAVNETLKALSDPNIWSIDNLYILTQIANGSMQAMPMQQQQQQQQRSNIPPSIGNVTGNVGRGDNGFNEFLGYRR